MNRESLRRLGTVAAVIVGLLIVFSILSQHAYFLSRVDQQEVGVRFRGGSIYEIVGPGVYSDVALFAEIKMVSSEAISFSVEDVEVITRDQLQEAATPGLREPKDHLRDGCSALNHLRVADPRLCGSHGHLRAQASPVQVRSSSQTKRCSRSWVNQTASCARGGLCPCRASPVTL